MILGMSVAAFTLLHVMISLLGIASGFLVVGGLLGSNRMPALTAVFLVTTIATSITGFMFPFTAVGPPHIVGAISLVVLAFTLLALYVYRLAGHWRWIYVSTAIAALYLNTFVGVVQAFQKIPALNVLAPKGSEPPFAIAQGLVLALFVAMGVLAVKKFHPTVASPTQLSPAVS
jgi:hypothetical protein